jgi:hypothetical protein
LHPVRAMPTRYRATSLQLRALTPSFLPDQLLQGRLHLRAAIVKLRCVQRWFRAQLRAAAFGLHGG